MGFGVSPAIRRASSLRCGAPSHCDLRVRVTGVIAPHFTLILGQRARHQNPLPHGLVRYVQYRNGAALAFARSANQPPNVVFGGNFAILSECLRVIIGLLAISLDPMGTRGHNEEYLATSTI